MRKTSTVGASPSLCPAHRCPNPVPPVPPRTGRGHRRRLQRRSKGSSVSRPRRPRCWGRCINSNLYNEKLPRLLWLELEPFPGEGMEQLHHWQLELCLASAVQAMHPQTPLTIRRVYFIGHNYDYDMLTSHGHQSPPIKTFESFNSQRKLDGMTLIRFAARHQSPSPCPVTAPTQLGRRTPNEVMLKVHMLQGFACPSPTSLVDSLLLKASWEQLCCSAAGSMAISGCPPTSAMTNDQGLACTLADNSTMASSSLDESSCKFRKGNQSDLSSAPYHSHPAQIP